MDGSRMYGDWQAFIVPDSDAILWWSFLVEQRKPISRKQYTDHKLGFTKTALREQPRATLVSVRDRREKLEADLRAIRPRIEVEFGYDIVQEDVVEGASVKQVQVTELPRLASFSEETQVEEEVIQVDGITYSVVVRRPHHGSTISWEMTSKVKLPIDGHSREVSMLARAFEVDSLVRTWTRVPSETLWNNRNRWIATVTDR
ncbi:hypothetical protein VR010_00880 [Actinomycetaceae bacterium L2_0104]